MDIKEYIQRAKTVINEDSGSEGMKYIVTFAESVDETDNDIFKLSEKTQVDGGYQYVLEFAFPHDYGFATNTLKAELNDPTIVNMQLVY